MAQKIIQVHTLANDLTGKTFGRLTVVGPARRSKSGNLMWLCNCSCGGQKTVLSGSLNNGRTQSCGCLRKETKSAQTHGLHGTPENLIWSSMLRRCKNKNNPRYGGRGISVCERWRLFKNFLEDMGPRPSPSRSVERVDNDGNYTPDNCIWATRKTQARNRRNNALLTMDGKTFCMSEWSEITGIKVNTIHQRINSGWSTEKALTEPVRKWGR